jgi:hypothetical protein
METQEQPGKNVITWEQFAAWARATGRDVTHVFRVFKGERKSPPLDAEFEQHFGFPMKDAELAGRRRVAAA